MARRGKALLCYYVVRAWLAWTTPCVAETAEDPACVGNRPILTSSVRATNGTEKKFCLVSILPAGRRLPCGVAHCGPLEYVFNARNQT